MVSVCRQTLAGHSGLIYNVDVATVKLPEATNPQFLAVSGSLDETIKVWDLHFYECLATWTAPQPYEGMSDNMKLKLLVSAL